MDEVVVVVKEVVDMVEEVLNVVYVVEVVGDGMEEVEIVAEKIVNEMKDVVSGGLKGGCAG